MRVFYDGDCYFCRNYAALAKLRSKVSSIELISLRSDHPSISEIRKRGFQVNRGFVVEQDGRWLEGSAAFAHLNLLMHGPSWFVGLLHWISARPRLVGPFYSVLVLGRYLLLAVQGLTLIELDPRNKAERYRLPARLTRFGLALSLPLLAYSVFARWSDGHVWAAAYSALVTAAVATFYLRASWRAAHLQTLLQRLSKGGWVPFLVFLIAFMLVVNGGHADTRRFIGLFVSAPIWGLFWQYGARAWRSTRKARLLAWLPAFTVLFAVVPGLMIGPFYGGIAGWVIRADKADPIKISGLKLVNDAGESHWFSHAFFQPHGQVGRFRRAFVAMPETGALDYMAFAFKTYERNFPMLERQGYPHQWALGSWAYPTHSLGNYDTAKLVEDFPPHRIERIERVDEIYDFSGTLLKRKIGKSLEVQSAQ